MTTKTEQELEETLSRHSVAWFDGFRVGLVFGALIAIVAMGVFVPSIPGLFK